MAKDTGSKGMSKYPKGAINQHKSLATGASLETVNKKNLDPSGWDGHPKPGISSSGDTGGGYKSTPPKTSRSTPA